MLPVGNSLKPASPNNREWCLLTLVTGTTNRWIASPGEGLIVLVPPDSTKRAGPRPGWTGGRYAFMRTILATDLGRELYEKRHQTIEPIFGQIKFNRHINRFLRRGRGAALTQWRLATATHNLLKLHQHRIAALTP